MSLERYVSISDVHFPFEDKTRYQVTINIFKSIKPHHIYLNGDIGEFHGVSAWPNHPSEKINFCQEVTYLNKKFDELQKLFPDVPVTYISGNHENRFFRYIRDLAPQMWGLIDCPQILNFQDRPLWRFVDYGPMQLVRCGKSNLYLRHEPLAGGGVSCAKSTAEKSYIDILFGHTHVHQVYSHKKFGPKPIITRAYSGGWLGDPSRHCFDYRGPKDSWVRGMSVIECDIKTGDYTYEFINLEKLPVLYRGVKYNAK